MEISKSIFREYDIRGIYKKTLNNKDAFMLGYFFGIIVKKNSPEKKSPLIIIGMDGRLSSPTLEEKTLLERERKHQLKTQAVESERRKKMYEERRIFGVMQEEAQMGKSSHRFTSERLSTHSETNAEETLE